MMKSCCILIDNNIVIKYLEMAKKCFYCKSSDELLNIVKYFVISIKKVLLVCVNWFERRKKFGDMKGSLWTFNGA